MVKALIGTEVDDVFKYPSGFFIDLRIFRCLSKYLLERKYNDILERDALKICM
jgi:hypothetical protein